MKSKSIKTSRHSRFKIEFDGSRNVWCIHDSKYNDIIEVSSKRIEAKNKCDILNTGTGFEDWQIPSFMRNTFYKKA